MSSSVRTLMLSCIFRVLFEKPLLGLILKAQVHVPTKAKHLSLFICGRNHTWSAAFEVGGNSRSVWRRAWILLGRGRSRTSGRACPKGDASRRSGLAQIWSKLVSPWEVMAFGIWCHSYWSYGNGYWLSTGGIHVFLPLLWWLYFTKKPRILIWPFMFSISDIWNIEVTSILGYKTSHLWFIQSMVLPHIDT